MVRTLPRSYGQRRRMLAEAHLLALPHTEGISLIKLRGPLSLLLVLLLLAGAGGCAGGASSGSQPGEETAAEGQATEWAFDKDQAGGPPAGAEVFAGKWTVREEAGASSTPRAVCQTGIAPFPAISLSKATYRDLTLTADFKPVSGHIDQAAGVIFRIQDKNNYYIVRANALEANINIYSYVDGKRTSLKEGEAPVAMGAWQELRVEASGSRIRGFLDGQLVVEANDDSFSAGGVGLWAKADSVTCFDNVRVTVGK